MTDDIEFTEINMDYTFERVAKDAEKKDEEAVHKQAQKSVKPKSRKKIDLNSIMRAPEKEASKSNGIGVLSVAEPKAKSGSFVQAAALKGYKDIKQQEQQVLEVKMQRYPYVKKDKLLTNAEQTLYKFMYTHLDSRITIFAKVRLADIFDVDERITRDSKYFYQISNKHIDFVICDKNTAQIICAVELDDYTHDTEERQARDKFVEEIFYDCKLPLRRIKFRIATIEQCDIREIEEILLNYYAPKCPACGGDMTVNESRRIKNKGHRFYGCVNYPRCRETIDID